MRRILAFVVYLITIWGSLYALVRGLLASGWWERVVLTGLALSIWWLGAGVAIRLARLTPRWFFSTLFQWVGEPGARSDGGDGGSPGSDVPPLDVRR